MIIISDKKVCCGCSACVHVCPKQCVSFNEDDEGFHYPLVDRERCINCGLCEKVCPMLSRKDEHQILSVFAAKNNNDDVRLKSSSGGIFTILAEAIIDEGGVVFGARFDENWEVMHDYTETKEGIEDFRTSKYVQSRIGNSYIQVRDFLKAGRKVLFSGIPCQIAGLMGFLRKEYANLLTVECVCHSVPSPGVWRSYLNTFLLQQRKSKDQITSISFRNKESGWKNYNCSITYNDGTRYLKYREKDMWMQGFVKGLYCRLSCTNCPAKAYTSCADITIGDLWGITQLAPEIDDDKGMCVVLTHTQKAQEKLKIVNFELLKEFSFKEVSDKNRAITSRASYNSKREIFYVKYQQGKNILNVIDSLTKAPLKFRMRQFFSKIMRTFIPR